MQRTIVAGADLSGEALADLKSWLGISRAGDDAMLEGLLASALELCEAFIGQAPLVQTVEERVALRAGWTELSSRPVNTLLSAELISEDGSRSPLDSSDFDFRLEAANSARFELKRTLTGREVAVLITSGIAADWTSLPAPLKQGMIRMAAHQYRDRDMPGAREVPPPASVAALWRPWRILRLA